MKKKSAYIKICIAVSLLILSAQPLAALADDPIVISFAFSNGSPPYTFDDGGKCSGILVKLLKIVEEEEKEVQISCTPLPWSRAQAMVQYNEMDALATYPSEARKKFAHFTSHPLFVQDFGYLAYNKNKPNINSLQSVQSYKDLGDFVFLGTLGVGWEEDNIPENIQRILVPNLKTAFKLMLIRNQGDFLVINPVQARYLATQLGFDPDQLGFVRAEFITNHVVPYHVGLRKNFPNAGKVIDRIDTILGSKIFREKSKQLNSSYQLK